MSVRQRRLATELDTSMYDAVVLTSREAVDYATGYRSVFGGLHHLYGMAAVVTPSRTWLICPAGDAAAAIDGGIQVDDVVTHGTFHFADATRRGLGSISHHSLADALRDRLRAIGAGRIGAEGTLADTAALRGVLADTGAVDAGPWMTSVRAVKLPAERELLRQAATIAEHAIEAAIDVAAPGVTERELAQTIAATMVAHGGDPRYIVVTAGHRSALADAAPSDAECQAGDLLRFDLGCQLEGYWSDIARTAVLGEPTSSQRSRYTALLEGLYEEITAMRPYARAGEIFRHTVEAVEKNGLVGYRRHHVGHGIGLSVYEQPVLAPHIDMPLLPGAVFSVETPYYELGWGGMMVEDTGVVTESGFELFTSIDRSLRVVRA